MANKYILQNKKTYRTLMNQKSQIRKYFPFIKCTEKNPILTCTGIFQPDINCNKYKVKIIYTVGYKPKVFIIKPIINYNDNIHLYSDGSLCLFHPTDLTWDDNKISIAKYIIPWISEWIIFYEIWEKTGSWLGKEVKHNSNISKT